MLRLRILSTDYLGSSGTVFSLKRFAIVVGIVKKYVEFLPLTPRLSYFMAESNRAIK